MKRIFVTIVMILFLSGCSFKEEDRFEDFEHFNLKGKDINYYTYIGDDGITDMYVIADITPDNYEVKIDGLFYKVSDNDYILLDKIENGNTMSKQYNFQYQDKLYVTSCNTMCHYEYTLAQEKTSKKELVFDVSKVGNQITLYYPTKVQDDYIYYYADMRDSKIDLEHWGKEYELKCSLDNYVCDVNEEQNNE